MAENKMMNSAGAPKLAALNAEPKMVGGGIRIRPPSIRVGGSMRRKRRTGRRGKKSVTMGGYKKRMNKSSRKRRRRRGGGEVMGLESKSSLGSSNVGN
jgi:hypothetical protein